LLSSEENCNEYAAQTMYCQSQAFPTEKNPDFVWRFLIFKKSQVRWKNPEFHNLVSKKPNWQPCFTFNTPSNQWWRFTLKPQIRLLPHERTKNN